MKRARLSFAFALAAGIALMSAGAARAEIEPRYYRQMQDGSPEHATVRVLSVKTSVTREKHPSGQVTLVNTRVEAQARVEAVRKTATGLKVGDTIQIQYVNTRTETPMVGPRTIPVLKEGQTYPAFLIGVSRGLYGAGARGASFEPLIEVK